MGEGERREENDEGARQDVKMMVSRMEDEEKTEEQRERGGGTPSS